MSEITQAQIRKFTAAWDIAPTDWYVKEGTIYIKLQGVTVGFDISVAGLPDYESPLPLTIVLEVPYAQPSPTSVE